MKDKRIYKVIKKCHQNALQEKQLQQIQFGLKGNHEDKSHATKFRTQLSLDTPRPQFNRNEFIFTLLSQQHLKQLTGQQVYALKFGLMLMPCDKYGKIISQDYNKAKPIALTSVNLSLVRLKQMGAKSQVKYFDMLDSSGKVYGQFQCILQYYENTIIKKNKQQQQQFQLNSNNNNVNINTNIKSNTDDVNKSKQQQLLLSQSRVLYDPLIGWMMYDQNCTDPLRQKNCINALEKQSNLLFQKYHQSKTQQQQYEQLLTSLQYDQKQLLDQLELLQKLNNKISEKLNQKQSLQGLKLEIDMLKGSRQGRQLLLDKVEYFQDRIMKQEEMYDELVKQYQKLKPQIEKKLKQGQVISMKLKGKQQQQFQIHNNTMILTSYQQTLYEYKSNQQVIQSLIKLSKKPSINQYTRQQAQLFLSQVKYEIKLEQLNIKSKMKRNEFANINDGIQEDYEQRLLCMIEQQMKGKSISKQPQQYNSNSGSKVINNNIINSELKQEQQLVMRIKLDSLNEQIEKIKLRINKLKDKQQMTKQFNHQKELNFNYNDLNKYYNHEFNNSSSNRLSGNRPQLTVIMNKSLMSTK